jgi:hypothetical protein
LVEVSKLMKEGRVILGKIFGMEIFYYICIWRIGIYIFLTIY